jgi:hypothetical protein
MGVMTVVCSVHGAVLLASVLLLWGFASQILRWAIFPYSAFFVSVVHHRDNNRRLADEMVRLYAELMSILKFNMTPNAD